jgi:predicted SAM-dependent methyltransferase
MAIKLNPEFKEFTRKNLKFLFNLAKYFRNVYLSILTKSRIRKILSENTEIRLELAAGNRLGENGWKTLDITANCDFHHDLRKGIPFPDNSVSKLYFSHFLEHLSHKEAIVFLKECHRVLKPGGTVSVAVPDARIFIEGYLGLREFDEKEFIVLDRANPGYTKIDYINYMAYMDETHKHLFDMDNLLAVLEKNGFRNVRPREFDPEVDKPERHFETIYAIGEK